MQADDKEENKGGRPSLYKPEYCQQLIEYFNVKPYKKEGDSETANDYPTLAGFAISLGVSRDTLHEWAKVHDEFSDAYDRAKDFQENYLLINGLKSLVNGQFAIFTAINNLGYRNKQKDEADTVINNNNNTLNITDAELDAKIQKLIEDKK